MRRKWLTRAEPIDRSEPDSGDRLFRAFGNSGIRAPLSSTKHLTLKRLLVAGRFNDIVALNQIRNNNFHNVILYIMPE